MAEVNEVLDDMSGDDAFFDPDAGELIPEGTYPAHIVKLTVRGNIQLKNGGSADIYVPTYRLHDSAGTFAGEDVDDNGIFRFKGGQRGGRRRSGTGNAQYKELLEVIGVPMREVDVGGKKKISLPPINEHDIFGTPVYVNIFHDSFMGRQGKVTIERAKIAHAWGDGEKLEVDDLPPF